MERLLTKKELAEHWKVSERTINNYMEDGIITPCKLPILRFNPQDVAKLDGMKLEKHSPLEWRRLQRELEFWRTKAEKMEETFNKLDMVMAEKRYLMQKEA